MNGTDTEETIYHLKSEKDFKVLLLYPNLSMLLAPPLSFAIFTGLLRKRGYQVDIFDVTGYVGEGASARAENVSVGDEMNTLRAEMEGAGDDVTFQVASTEEHMVEMMQSRPFSYEKDLGVQRKTGLYEDFVEKIESFKPDLILTSIVEDTFLQTIKLMSLITEKKIPTLHGGVFVTAAPELALTYPGVDMIGIGEGEQIVLDVADRIRRGASCNDVPGVWIKDQGGSIVKNRRGPLFDFKQVIPDYSLFESERFYRPMGGRFFKSVTIEAYRGCPYTCAYCNSPMQTTLAAESGLGNYVRRAPFGGFRDYLASVVEQVHPTFVMFADDSFLARPKKEIELFCEVYEEFKIPFWFNTRPENVTSENLRMLKDVNCYRMSFGLECGNEEFRAKVLLRPLKNEILIKKFKIIAEAGIPFSINNIIGFPNETRELIFETIELNRQMSAYDALTVSCFVPYHGTVLRDRAVEQELVDKDSIVCDLHHSTLNMPQLPVEEIDGLLRTFPLYVHFDKSVWPDIKRAEIFDDEGDKIFRRLSTRYQEEAFSLDQNEKIKASMKISGSVGCDSNELDSFRLPPAR
jgi:anaerobic magnesium-protoporphyrin IX monomethyl ester cyclase